jgi:electron transport complex protein RnfD
LGYAFLLISYPLPMTTWASEFVNFSQAFDVIFNLNSNMVDALSGATHHHLMTLKMQLL